MLLDKYMYRLSLHLAQTLSPDQKKVLSNLTDWLSQSKSNYITVGGYAGTGKTTLISLLRKLIHHHQPKKSVAFACFTGKASQVLKNKLLQNQAVYPKDFCGTIHSLMYTPSVDKEGRISGWHKNKKLKQDLIIIDEASMVTSDIWQDLLDYGVPIIAVGDHGQLPPIGDKFNLMQSPKLTLEHIHRQAQDSPIIQVATLARTTGKIPQKSFSSNIKKITPNHPDANDIFENFFSSSTKAQNTLVLCATNNTRIKLNQQIRNKRGFDHPEPQIGETLICLKNNYDNKDGPIYNGMSGVVQNISPYSDHWFEAKIHFPDENRTYQGQISRYQFNQSGYLDTVPGLHYSKIGDRFDFGYAITVHKAQGSQAETVILFEQRNRYQSDDEWSRWLYTAVTRAQENLYIIGN